jgi:UDP-N-acetyl-D-mannosaminuronic acid transferase (WecB/TagA/CpsF family)
MDTVQQRWSRLQVVKSHSGFLSKREGSWIESLEYSKGFLSNVTTPPLQEIRQRRSDDVRVVKV